MLFTAIQPDEVYHLSAPSHVRGIVDDPDYVDDISGIDTTRLLEAIRRMDHECRFFAASSAEMYGASAQPRDDAPPFEPRSVYGAAKVYSHWITTIYREGHGVFAVNGVLYDHDSPRRADAYVTRRITRAAARIKAGYNEHLRLSDVDVPHDLGYAKEYVDAMWRMLQADAATDYVVATGKSSTLRDFLGYAFEAVDLDWREHVSIAPSPGAARVPALIGDTSKAEQMLGWTSRTSTRALAQLMVEADLELARAGSRV